MVIDLVLRDREVRERIKGLRVRDRVVRPPAGEGVD